MSYNTLPGRGSNQSHDHWHGIDLDEELDAMAATAPTITAKKSSPTIRALTGGHNSVEEWVGSLDMGLQQLAAAAVADTDPDADREELVRDMSQTDHYAG